MRVLLFIVLGLLPAIAPRYAILRKAISNAATAGACFGILIFVAILVSSDVEKSAKQAGEDITVGPLPILTRLVSRMFYVGVPVLVGSYFILRRGAGTDDDG
jgi:hypothetical protein